MSNESLKESLSKSESTYHRHYGTPTNVPQSEVFKHVNVTSVFFRSFVIDEGFKLDVDFSDGSILQNYLVVGRS